MLSWKALSGRLSFFLTGRSPIPSALELFRPIWGDEPTNFQRQTNPLGVSVAQGSWGGMSVTCSVQPSRIDLNLSPLTPAIGSDSLVLLNDALPLNRELKRLIQSLHIILQPLQVNRVAVFLQFVIACSGHLEANKMVLAVLPKTYRIPLKHQEDFILQVNKPKKSGQGLDTRLNLIHKWSVERYQILSLQIAAGALPISGNFPVAREYIVASVSFDNNNHPTDTPLSIEQQVAIMSEELEDIEKSQRDYGLNVEGF